MALTKVTKIVSNLTAADVGAVATSAIGAANGVASLDASGQIPSAQLPAIAITNTYTAANEAAMLALVAEVGDVCIRTDLAKTFILTASPATTLANWIEMLAGGKVTSVNGQTGVVSITTITGNAGTATTLATPRTIALSGDATGSASFDGGTNATIDTTLATSGVTAGTYNNSATAHTPFTVDAKGRITATSAAVTVTPAYSSITSKPTTISGLALTDLTAMSSTTPLMSGTAAVGTSTTAARSDHAHPTDTTRAALASPTFTGIPAAPTAAAATNTTQIATTAFVRAARPIQGIYTMLTSSATVTCPASITVPLIIAVNGIIQEQGASGGYTISSTTLTFAEALPIGSVIFALGYTS